MVTTFEHKGSGVGVGGWRGEGGADPRTGTPVRVRREKVTLGPAPGCGHGTKTISRDFCAVALGFPSPPSL